jgi:hypothetical protein
MRLLKHVHAIGAGLSFGCAIHCLLMPVGIALFPMFALTYRVSIGILILSTMLCLGSLCWGFRKHTRLSPLLVMAVGFFLLFATDHRGKYHIAISLLGSICYLASYLLNMALCHFCHYKCKGH